MAHLEMLRKDHLALRQALAELEEVLRAARPQEAVVCRCQLLAQRLQSHILQEEETLAPYAERIQAAMREHRLPDHADSKVVLRDLQELLSSWRFAYAAGSLLVHLSRLLDELREYLDEEERETLPIATAAETERRPWMEVT